MSEIELIFEADDGGYAKSVNEGIIKAHQEGVLTSASVMVFRSEAEATSQFLDYPNLSVGLHIDMTEEGIQRCLGLGRLFFKSHEEMEEMFLAQVDKFRQIMGKDPSHFTGHHAVDRIVPNLRRIVDEYSLKNGIPIRGTDSPKFQMGFFGRGITRRQANHKISPLGLIDMIRNLPPGKHEIMCHPALSPLTDSGLIATGTTYLAQRQSELDTLTSHELKSFLESEPSIALINWNDI